MKRKTLAITAIIIIATISAVVAYLVLSSQQLSPPGTATYDNNGLDIKVTYFRPSKRGRVIFGDSTDGALQPNGQYWRLGANDATEITFSKGVIFAGQPLKAGSYRMYAVLDELSWEIVLNSELGQGGSEPPDYDLDVLKVNVPVKTLPLITEQFTISFDNYPTGVNMNLDWDNRRATVTIGVQ